MNSPSALDRTPFKYRLSITADARARAVIEKVAAMARWNPKEPGGSGRGRGMAFARYTKPGGLLRGGR